MKTLSPGKYRRLQRCSTANGALVILSVDQRSSLKSLLGSGGSEVISDDHLTAIKEMIVKALGDQASAILLDPQYGAGQLISRGSLPKSAGLITAIETSGYAGSPVNRTSQILAGWSASKAARLGAEGVRLLVYYHPEADSAPAIESLVDSIAHECQLMDLPLFLAALPYSIDPQAPTLDPAQHREVILDTAHILTAIPGVDIYMCEFPVVEKTPLDIAEWETACASLSQASHVPWVLISSTLDFDVFLRMTEIACRQGASGAAAGRAAWQAAVTLSGEKQRTYLNKTSRSRFSQLVMTCDSAAKPWTEFYKILDLSPDWYTKYTGINNHSLS